MATNVRVSGYLPNDKPDLGRLTVLGLQHVITMFPATILVALLCGFHPSTVLLGAGVSTIVALLLSRNGIGKFIPLFYGSSFSYIAAYLGLAAAMGHPVKFGQPSPDNVIALMQAGIICTGESYKKIVKLTFAAGASLEDPDRLFNSSLDGKLRRAIDIHEGETVDASAFKALVRRAVALNESRTAGTKPARQDARSAANPSAIKPTPTRRR